MSDDTSETLSSTSKRNFEAFSLLKTYKIICSCFDIDILTKSYRQRNINEKKKFDVMMLKVSNIQSESFLYKLILLTVERFAFILFKTFLSKISMRKFLS